MPEKRRRTLDVPVSAFTGGREKRRDAVEQGRHERPPIHATRANPWSRAMCAYGNVVHATDPRSQVPWESPFLNERGLCGCASCSARRRASVLGPIARDYAGQQYVFVYASELRCRDRDALWILDKPIGLVGVLAGC